MKTKFEISNRILSLVLALVMVLGMLPMMNMTAYAATEVPELSKLPFIDYTDGATQYFKYDNYLYRVIYTNLQNVTTTSLYINNSGKLFYCPSKTSYKDLINTEKNAIRTSDLPKSADESLSCYGSSSDRNVKYSDYRIVWITYVEVDEPSWDWSDSSSPTATFTAKNTDVCATVKASNVSSNTIEAANCQEKDKTTYTASVTFNGQTYTDTKTDKGDIGPHNISCSLRGNAVTANCENSGCPLSTGNSVTLNIQDVYYYTGQPIPDPVTGEFNHNMATYKVTYNGSEILPSAVGSYKVTLNAFNADGVNAAGFMKSFVIEYLDAPSLSEFKVSDYTYKNGDTYWFAPGATATVTPPEGYMISTMLGGTYGGSVSFDEDDSKTVYLKRTSDGAMTDAIDLSSILRWDITAPMGSIKLSPHAWDDLNINSSFTVFSKDSVEISITAQDTESGVKSVQYYVADRDLINGGDAAALEAAVDANWKTYNDAISLPLNGKYIVYAKITDYIGNVTYLSSDGIVLYSDATSTTTHLTTTYKAGEDKDIFVALNGNTIKEVKCGDTALLGTDYTVSGDKITLNADYLDTLAAGDYTITISLNPLGETYLEYPNNVKPAELTVNLTVNKRQVAVPTEDITSFVYDGGEQTYNITPSDWYTVTGNKQTNAGTYTVTVSLKDKNSTVWDDGTTEDKTYTFHIDKKTVDLSGVKWDYTEPFKYDGLTHGVAIDESTMPYGASVSRYTGHSYIDAGSRQAAASIIYDDNHKGEATLLLDWEIVNNWTPTEYTVSGEGWMNQDFVITPSDGYLISLTNTANGKWKDSLTYSDETDNGSVKFYLKNEADGTISLAKTVSYKLDKTDPTGKVEFDERNGWETFLNTISFNLFYKDEVTVKVTTDNDLSGIAKIEYASSDKAMTLNEVMDIADWTEYNGSFGVTKPEAEKFVYFIRITDNAGNVTYLSTDGAQYDTTAPVISGIENGRTYYTTQKVTITDKNIDTITFNGEQATENITLEGNKEATYTIVATDKAGNKTTVIVTMKPIKELAKATENLGNDNVTSNNAPALRELVETLNELIADPDTSDDGERETLEQHKHIAESLLKTIEDAAKAIETENTEKVKDVTAENVTPKDKTDLEKAKEDLEKALEDYASNMTEDEKKAIQDELGRIDDALRVIGNVEAVEELIDKLPDTIKKDDEAAIKAADDALGALTDYEKSLVDKNAKKALDDAKAALAELKKPADSTTPATGDNSNLFLWIAMLFISGGAVITLTVVDRKKRSAANK